MGIDIHYIQNIRKISRNQKSVTVHNHFPRSVALQRNKFPQTIEESQIIIEHSLVRIVQELIQHSLMVDNTDFMSAGMTDKKKFVVASDTPYSRRPLFGLIYYNGTEKFLPGNIYHTESTRVHPPLL